MPERRDDNNAIWKYQTVFPGMDTEVNRVAVTQPKLVEATGVDGRFLGAVRAFPGFADATVHGVPTPAAGTTITSISNIIYAKYVAIQKGISGDMLRGIVLVGDNPGGDNKSVYFSYVDSSDGSSDVVELEDFQSWDDFRLSSGPPTDKIDVTAHGRYIYLVVSHDTTSPASLVPSFVGKEPPYNKAYFWDWKINTWDKFVTGMDGRFMSIMPQRVLGTLINENGSPADSWTAFTLSAYGASGHTQTGGNYTFAAEVVSRKHNLRSYLRMRSLQTAGVNTAFKYWLDLFKLPVDEGAEVHQLKGNATSDTCIINWGIPHCDGFRLWRSPVDDWNELLAQGTYGPVGALYPVDSYIEKGVYQPTSATLTREYDADSLEDTTRWDGKSTWYTDAGLVAALPYNAFADSFSPAPRMKRVTAYNNMLVGVTDVQEPASPDDKWETAEQKPQTIVFSSLTTQEPENFPPGNSYPADEAGEEFPALEPAGDHVFAISNMGVYKLTRSGSILAFTRLQFRLGGVSRYAQTGVGNVLFMVTKAGVKSIDGNTGAIRSISALNRIITDDGEWAQSLDKISLEYDASLGCLVFLNTSTQECILLWEATGAVTRLVDCPWSFLVGGVNALSTGPQRCYFVTSSGAVHCIDGAREMGKITMCGTGAAETVNGTATSGAASSLTDTGATFPANCVGFELYVYIDSTWERQTITVRNSGTQLTTGVAFSRAIAASDRYSVAPVIGDLEFSQLYSEKVNNIDPFVRKTSTSISCAFSDLTGELASGDDNKYVEMGVSTAGSVITSSEVAFDDTPDVCVGRANASAVRLHPHLKFYGSNIDWELQAVLVRGLQGISEAESRQS